MRLPHALPILYGFAVSALVAGDDGSPTEWRTWTYARRPIEAALRGVDGTSVILQARDGRNATLPLEQMSGNDWLYTCARAPAVALAGLNAAGGDPNAASAGWAGGIRLPAGLAKVTVLAPGDGGGCIFDSAHFSFTCGEALPESLMPHIAQSFELVRHLHASSPWREAVPAGGSERLAVTLFPETSAYWQAGGHAPEAGDYDPNTRRLRCCFEGLGITKAEEGYVMRARAPGAGQIRRLVSLAMFEEVADVLPPWVSLGLSDLASEVPVLEDWAWPAAVDFGQWMWSGPTRTIDAAMVAQMLDPATAASVASGDETEGEKRRSLQRLNARVLTQFFFQAGAGKGLAFGEVMATARKCQRSRAAHLAALARYAQEWESFKKLPGVVDMGGGRYRYPSDLTAPVKPVDDPVGALPVVELQRQALASLLGGRSASEVAEQAVQASANLSKPAERAEPNPKRPWQDAAGRTIEATLQGFEGGQVLLRTAEKTVRVPLAQLSAKDQCAALFGIADLVEGGRPPAAGAPTSPAAVAQSRRSWPGTLTAPDGLTNAVYLKEQSERGRHLYRTSHFSYTVHANVALNVALMKNLARVFEGTYELLKQSPFGLQAQPKDGLFEAHFYIDRRSYIQAGGPSMSGGVYMSERKVFMVPFESLGIVRRGDSYVKDEYYQVQTLVHELTHMMMHDVLPVIPMWFAEGSAEYTETIPFKNGAFNHSALLDGVKACNRRAGATFPFVQMLNITPSAWMATSQSGGTSQRALYHTSLLMTYYFMHLDGDRRGTRLLKFLDACRAEKTRMERYDAAMTLYEKEIKAFKTRPDVRTFPDGRIEYPSFVSAPVAPALPDPAYGNGKLSLIHLPILLDGRTVQQVAEEMTAALKALDWATGR